MYVMNDLIGIPNASTNFTSLPLLSLQASIKQNVHFTLKVARKFDLNVLLDFSQCIVLAQADRPQKIDRISEDICPCQ